MVKIDVFVYTFVIFLFLSEKSVDARIGINWGRMTTTSLIPSMVVDLLLQNKISDVKLYNINDDIIRAFSGTGIGVTISIPSDHTIKTLEMAKDWVRLKIEPFPQVNIRYVLVKNNAFAVARFEKMPYNMIVTALTLVQRALDELGYGRRIKAILSNSYSGVLKQNYSRPSEAEFIDNIKEPLLKILNILNQNNAPFLFDIFPISFIQVRHLDTNFGFLDNKSSYIVKDVNGHNYNNFLDFVRDSFVWALRKSGFPDMKIVVGQIGWPTDGFPGASTQAAERFYKGLLPYVSSKKGTPMRPGAPIDIYIHSLLDEKKNPITLPFMRHWGIYMTNGQPKFKIDLSGQGKDMYPTTAKGIHLMPYRWCVFKGMDKVEDELVKQQVNIACQSADCTSLSPGGSCDILSPDESVSYAFNAYFQTAFQDETACDFGGLADVVAEDPSRDGCIFSVEVVRGSLSVLDEDLDINDI